MGFLFKILVVLVAVIVGVLVAFNSKKYPVFSSGAILITGCSSGIGRNAALALDSLGYVVYATVRNEKDAKSLTDERSTLRALIVDVRDEEKVNAVADSVRHELEKENLKLVGLVNNAGISRRVPMELESMDKLKTLFEVNVYGVLYFSRAFTPLLREAGGGRIVNIGSVAGIVATKGAIAYSGAKFALEAMTDVMRLELSPWDISVSIVEPGYVKTAIAGKQTGSNSNLKDLDHPLVKYYQEFVDTFDEKRVRTEEKYGADPVVTDNAIIHALTSEYPRTRYPCANVGPISATALSWIIYLLPDRLQDELLLRI